MNCEGVYFFQQQSSMAWLVEHWHRLPREDVDAPSLEGFKARLHGALGSLSWWVTILPTAQGWNWMILKVPSNPNHPMILWFYNSMTLVLAWWKLGGSVRIMIKFHCFLLWRDTTRICILKFIRFFTFISIVLQFCSISLWDSLSMPKSGDTQVFECCTWCCPVFPSSPERKKTEKQSSQGIPPAFPCCCQLLSVGCCFYQVAEMDTNRSYYCGSMLWSLIIPQPKFLVLFFFLSFFILSLQTPL